MGDAGFVGKGPWRRTERRWRSGGFDVDQLWIWCFVCAEVTPRSGRKMRKAFWKPLPGWRLPEAQPKQGGGVGGVYPLIRAVVQHDLKAEK